VKQFWPERSNSDGRRRLEAQTKNAGALRRYGVDEDELVHVDVAG
jgi:hypothetical protein